MEIWEEALAEFMKDWEEREDVTGAIVCGSYITGNPSVHSDIDVHIILSKDCSWRERGNVIIDGILIEYFVNPAKMHKEYAEQDYNSRKKINNHMFATGKVLFDRTGELEQIIKEAKSDLNKPFQKRDSGSNEFCKYSLWDMCDNLEELFESGTKDFHLAYYNDLYTLFDSYSAFLGYDFIPKEKVFRFLKNEADKNKYKVEKHPDSEFVDMFLDCLDIADSATMMNNFKRLTDYVLEKMSGFNINGWKIKTETKPSND